MIDDLSIDVADVVIDSLHVVIDSLVHQLIIKALIDASINVSMNRH
jgi:hypothetical protein